MASLDDEDCNNYEDGDEEVDVSDVIEESSQPAAVGYASSSQNTFSTVTPPSSSTKPSAKKLAKDKALAQEKESQKEKAQERATCVSYEALPEYYHWADLPLTRVDVFNSDLTHCYYSSQPVTYFSDGAGDKDVIYYSKHCQFGPKDPTTSKLLIAQRRFRCSACGEAFACKFVSNIVEHMRSKHVSLLAWPDYTSKMKEAVKTKYDAALAMKATNEVPEVLDGRSAASKRTQSTITSKFPPKESLLDSFSDVLVEAVCLGGFAFDIMNNPGFQKVIKHFTNGTLPPNTSARTLKRRFEQLYDNNHKTIAASLKSCIGDFARVELLATVPIAGEEGSTPLIGHDLTDGGGVVGIQQDGWSDRKKNGFLGIIVNCMIRSSLKWEIRSLTLALEPFTGEHTAANARDLIKKRLALMGVSLNSVIASTQDTAKNSLNVFKHDTGIAQVECFAHLSNLILKHGLEEAKYFNDVLKAIHDVCVKVGGGRRSLELLHNAQQELAVNSKVRPLNSCATRWNVNLDVVERYKVIKQAVEKIDVTELYKGAKEKTRKMTHFNDSIKLIKEGMPLMDEVLPFMRTTAQWVQILSSHSWVTLSLVRVAALDFEQRLVTMRLSIAELNTGDANSRDLAEKLKVVYSLLVKYVTKYFSPKYVDQPLFQAASYLDPRCHYTLEDYECAQEQILRMCSKEEKQERLPAHSATVSTESTRRNRGAYNKSRSDATVAAPLDLRSPIKKEMDGYEDWVNSNMDDNQVNTCDALVYWPTVLAIKFPILARIAAILFAVQPCSSGVERLFSLSGRTMTIARGAMKTSTLAKLTALASWLKDTDASSTIRSQKRQKGAARFASLKATATGLTIESGAAPSLEDEDAGEVDEGAERLLLIMDKRLEKKSYPGAVLPCPTRVPKDLVEGARVAVYFYEDEKSGWCEGVMEQVHKGYVNIDNITVRYEKTDMWNASTHDFCANASNYGITKDWVLLDPPVVVASPQFSDDDESEA